MVVDVSGMIMQISFFIMAMNWPDFGKECDKIDFYMKRYGFPKCLKLKLSVMCVVMMIIGLGKSRNVRFPSIFKAFLMHCSLVRFL